MPTDTPPRRKWRITRWLIVGIIATLGWGGWRAHTFRSALSQAKALGWRVEYTDPAKEIRTDWKAAFKKATWLDGVTNVLMSSSESLEQHLAIVHRLTPKRLTIGNAATLRDLSPLKSLSALQEVHLINCTGLKNVDGLKNLSALQMVSLSGCTGLTNVDALEHLSALRTVYLSDCGLANVDGLKNLSALQKVWLDEWTELANVDALKNLSKLKWVHLNGCTGLTNVDALKNLPALRDVYLEGCTGLTKESVAALKAALPKAQISGP